MPNLNCDAVLIQNIDFTTASLDVRRAMYRSISEETYNAIKDGVKTAATIPIEGIPIDFSGDYDHFNEQRRAYFSREIDELAQKEARSELHSYLKDSQVAAWVTCIGIQAGTVLTCRAKTASEDHVAVTIAFNPAEDGVVGEVYSELSGGTPVETQGVESPAAFPAGFTIKRGEITRSFVREPGTAFSLVITVNDKFTDSVFLPKPAPPARQAGNEVQNSSSKSPTTSIEVGPFETDQWVVITGRASAFSGGEGWVSVTLLCDGQGLAEQVGYGSANLSSPEARTKYLLPARTTKTFTARAENGNADARSVELSVRY